MERQLGARLWPVHRLDAEVTGLILYAKDADAHRQANGWFEGRRVDKTYEALSEGNAETATFADVTWHSTLMRGKKRAYENPHGKPSETRAQLLGTVKLGDGEALHWRLMPRTGRPHQLRFELARHGFPIIGDALYGSKRTLAKPGIALRCVGLGLGQADGAKALGLPDDLRVTPLLEWLMGPEANA